MDINPMTANNINTAPNFLKGGIAGIATSGGSSGQTVITQLDGKIILAGYTVSNGVSVGIASRFNVDGTLDTTFGSNGIIVARAYVFGNAGSFGDLNVRSVSYNPVDNSFLFLSDNSLIVKVNSYGTYTYPVLKLGGSESFFITTLSDGSSLVAGQGFSITKLSSAGGIQKKYTASFDLGSMATGVDTQSDGKIVAAGYTTSNGTSYQIAIARFNTDGSLDASFSTDGKATAQISGGKSASSVIIQSDGKILVANGTNLVRFNADGTLDSSFDVDGNVDIPFTLNSNTGQSIVEQSDGKLLVVGSIFNGVNYDVALARYNSNGTIDSIFGGGDGIATTPLGLGNDYGLSIAIDNKTGKIYVSGTSSIRNPNLICFDSNGDDLPPINRTSHFSKKSITLENDGHENKQI